MSVQEKFEIIISLPNSFRNESFVSNFEENKYVFILTGIIVLDPNNDQEFYMSNYIADKNNNLWVKLTKENASKSFTWTSLLKKFVENELIPITLLFVRSTK